MKVIRISRFFILPLAAAVILFASCGDDDPIEERYKLTPPTGCIKAEPGIIGVDSKGNLTLDGYTEANPVYVVYFKWGSLIAMKGEAEGDGWTDGIADVAWVPDEYKSKLGDITDYASVPYAESGVFPTDSPADGLGDPCHFAKKGGVAGGYRMPTGDLSLQFTIASGEESGGTFGQPGLRSIDGEFYSAVGFRYYSDGTFSNSSSGYYWGASTTGTYGCGLHFTTGAYSYLEFDYVDDRANGFAIRCVRQ